MTTLQPVRGTHDLLPEDMRRHRRVVETAREVAERFGYLEIETPIFEFSEVFKRTLGDTSDIVTKEMYSFTDRGDIFAGAALTMILVAATLVLLLGLERITARATGS